MSRENKLRQTRTRVSQVVFDGGWVHLTDRVPDAAGASITEQITNILNRMGADVERIMRNGR